MAPARRLILVALLLAAGVGAATAAPVPSPSPSPAPHAVRYRLTWATDDVTPTAGGGGWEVDTNRGYHVRVTRGWVTSYSMELVECPRTATRDRDPGWLWPFGASPAFAGHMAGTPNPAALRVMRVESLTEPAAADAGTLTLAPQAYCAVHYLVARAAAEATSLPSGLDMVDVSLHVEGTFRAPGTTTDANFTIHTASAYGQLFERAGAQAKPIRVDTGASGWVVAVRRWRSRLFDGVDFTTMSAKSAGLRMMQGFVDGTEVLIEADDARR